MVSKTSTIPYSNDKQASIKHRFRRRQAESPSSNIGKKGIPVKELGSYPASHFPDQLGKLQYTLWESMKMSKKNGMISSHEQIGFHVTSGDASR